MLFSVESSKDWFVTVNGTGTACSQTNPCPLGTALALAGDGDTICLGGGTYTGTSTEVIAVTGNVTILGGWDGASSGAVVRDPGASPTILDGQNSRRVAYITGTVSPRLEGLTFTRGNATGLGGDLSLPWADVGGAVYANGTSAVVTNCRILSSTAGFGGGLAFYYGAPTLGNSTVQGNTAVQYVAPLTRGLGGGVFLYHSPATIVGNMVIRNVASGTTQYDGGGGLYLDASAAQVVSNTIQGNSSPSSQGAGLYLYQSAVVLRENFIAFNIPAMLGGGVFMWLSPAHLQANFILDNEAINQGGGLCAFGCYPFTMTNNIIGLNRSQGIAAGMMVAGSGSPWQGSQGTMLHNTFVHNTSSVPWMVHVGSAAGSPARLVFTDTLFDKPGGVAVDPTGSVILDTTLWHSSLLIQPGLTVTGTAGGTVITRNDVYGDPDLAWNRFFRLGPNSAAIDAGVNAGVAADIDGQFRPAGSGYDIGADEFYPGLCLPVIHKE